MVFRPESVTQTQIQDYAGIQKTYTYDLTDAANSKYGNPVFIYLHHNMAVLEIDGHLLADTNNEAHIGINNVTLRLQIMCGGTLNITPRPGGGTMVTILIP